MAWISSGRLVNPAIDAVLLDTVALTAGIRTPQAIVTSTVTAQFELQLRDAANAATLRSQILSVVAMDTFDFTFNQPIQVALNERLRILAVGTIVGTVSVSMNYQV